MNLSFVNKIIYFAQKKKTVTIIGIILCHNLLCQDKIQLEFIGTLNLPDSSFITYKLNFAEAADQKIEGYSITDFYGTQKTKSRINGSINRAKKTISFAETENLSTTSDAKPNEFCYVNVTNAKIKTKNKKCTIIGKFQGKFNNDTNCISGKLFLIGTDFLANLNELGKKDTLDHKLKNQKINGLLKNAEDNLLTAKDVLKLNWNSGEIIMELWDGGAIDQDKISVFLNEKNILENFEITAKKKIIIIPFKEDYYKIKILATNEGKTKPNTVSIVLKDKDSSTPIKTNLKIGEITTIIIQKRKINGDK